MASTATKFELHMPLGIDQQTIDAATTFMSGLTSHGIQFYVVNSAVFNIDGSEIERDLIYGILTPTQTSAALTLLNNLNTALGSNVVCWTSSVTTQP